MPIPEEKLYHSMRINRWFAFSSTLMTASILWMITVDYDRPWREYQDDYYRGRAVLARLDYLDSTRQERLNEIADAERRLADAKQFAAETSASKRAVLVKELADADLAFRQANAPWSRASQVLEVTKDTYERALSAHGPGHSVTKSAEKTFHEEEENVDRLRKENEHWEDVKKQLEAQLKELDEPVRTAEKRLSELQEPARAALQKDQQFRGVLTDTGLLGGLPIVKAIINAPLLDFTAPKNTPSRHQINQLVLPDVRQRLNYLESYTTDRCTTCHVAIDDVEFSQERLARKLERSLPGVSEALQRMGKPAVTPPQAPTIAGRGTALPVGQVAEYWDELTKKQRDDYFDELLKLVNGYLKLDGRKTIELGQPILAHPDLDLYLSVDSPHPMAKVGCTVCHEGNPQETDFVQAAHSPPTHEIEKEWKNRYYIHSLGVPNITFETIAHYWDRPMRLPRHTEAGCAKCHTQITDISRFQGERKGARINQGQHLFREVGCINCHNVEALKDSRKVGPDLTSIAAKLTPGFAQQWAFFPQKFRPSTRMPHFFQQENNRAESVNQFDPDPVLRTETEVAAISKYLFSVSKPWKPLPKPEDVQGDAARGKELFTSIGCLACHSNMAEFGEEWITKDLIHREGLNAETAFYRYKAMNEEERVRYAMEHFADQTDTIFEPEMVRFDPDRAYSVPTFNRFAPELSGIGSKVNADWLYSWLIEPTHYAPETKMPSFRLTPPEAADITAYLMTLKKDEFIQKEFPTDGAARKMADDLMFSLLAAQRSERRSRAIMNDEGTELTDMLVSYLRGSLGERAADGAVPPMTADDIRLHGEQAAYDLIRPMSLEDKKLMFLGNKMIAHYGCYACHIIPGFEETTPPGTDLGTAAANWAEKPVTQLDFAFYDDAFHGMREEKQDIFGFVYPRDAKELNYWSPIPDDAREQITHTHAAFAKHKMLNPRIWDREKIKRPYDKLKMPNYYFTEEEAEALTTYLLSRMPARVTDRLMVDYEGEPLGPIAAGRSLTRELNCVACHQIEDNAPAIQQYFLRTMGGRKMFDEVNAPPRLWGEGAKVQHHWLSRFFQHVETLRPWLQVRMPSFNLTNKQSTALAEYFAALSQHESKTLGRTLAPIKEYIEKAHATAKAAGEDTPQTGGDWFEKDQFQAAAASLRQWAIERKLIRAGELDLLATPPDELASSYAKVLNRVGFLEELYEVEFPFVEQPAPLASEEKFELGGRLLIDMGCLKCHVMGRMLPGPARTIDDFVQVYRLDGVRGEGDQAVAVLNGTPYPVGSVIDGFKLTSAINKVYEDTGDIETKAVVEGSNAKGETESVLLVAASAPNLSLTHQRLRRKWVYDWMLEPGWIQPGTKMPQNFPGGKSPYEGDPKYPGSSADQIDLLIDYLYDAGVKGARVPLPKNPAPAAKEEFEEVEEFED